VENPYFYTGRRLDTETAVNGAHGLYYFRARYFSAPQGRFISRDPIGYADGMHLYAAYFGSHFGVDPTGLEMQINIEGPRSITSSQIDGYKDFFKKLLGITIKEKIGSWTLKGTKEEMSSEKYTIREFEDIGTRYCPKCEVTYTGYQDSIIKTIGVYHKYLTWKYSKYSYRMAGSINQLKKIQKGIAQGVLDGVQYPWTNLPYVSGMLSLLGTPDIISRFVNYELELFKLKKNILDREYLYDTDERELSRKTTTYPIFGPISVIFPISCDDVIKSMTGGIFPPNTGKVRKLKFPWETE